MEQPELNSKPNYSNFTVFATAFSNAITTQNQTLSGPAVVVKASNSDRNSSIFGKYENCCCHIQSNVDFLSRVMSGVSNRRFEVVAPLVWAPKVWNEYVFANIRDLILALARVYTRRILANIRIFIFTSICAQNKYEYSILVSIGHVFVPLLTLIVPDTLELLLI